MMPQESWHRVNLISSQSAPEFQDVMSSMCLTSALAGPCYRNFLFNSEQALLDVANPSRRANLLKKVYLLFSISKSQSLHKKSRKTSAVSKTISRFERDPSLIWWMNELTSCDVNCVTVNFLNKHAVKHLGWVRNS